MVNKDSLLCIYANFVRVVFEGKDISLGAALRAFKTGLAAYAHVYGPIR